jgi:ADP-heptose:LPS heptosyltransferase
MPARNAMIPNVGPRDGSLDKLVLLGKNLLRFGAFLLLDLLLLDLLVLRSRRRDAGGRLLLVRLDAIGDYVLFRNFLEALRTAGPYRDHSITLVGNEAWRALAERLDADWIDAFIWVDRRRMMRDARYRVRKLREIAAQDFELVVHPTFSREFFFGDWICRVARATRKIGSAGNLGNLAPWQKAIADRWYTRLLDAAEGTKFEYLRNEEFFAALLGAAGHSPGLRIRATGLESKLPVPAPVFILCPGASVGWKKWPADSFGKLAHRIREAYGAGIVLLGGPGDAADAQAVLANGPPGILDLTGRTSLVDLVAAMSGCACVVANDSAPAHIAAALGVPAVVVTNGNHLGRFFPYPPGFAPNCRTVLHPWVEEHYDLCDREARAGEFLSRLDMRGIPVERVERAVHEALSAASARP